MVSPNIDSSQPELYFCGKKSAAPLCDGSPDPEGFLFPTKVIIENSSRVSPAICNNLVDIKCGTSHTLLLSCNFAFNNKRLANGKVYAFGGGLFGEQGNGSKTLNSPKIHSVKIPQFVSRIFAGGESSGAVTRKGDLYLWGANFNGNLAISNNNVTLDSALLPTLLNSDRFFEGRIISVALSSYHTLFLTEKGHVYSCGRGRGGKLGHGDEENAQNVPTQISTLENITKIACSDEHSVACNSKDIYTWGEGSNGKLGHGVTNALDRFCKDEYIPKKATFDKFIQTIDCGNKFTVILDRGLKLSTAGNLDKKKVWHQDDFSFASFQEVLVQFAIIKVSCGKTHFMAIDAAHLLYGAGEGSHGCLGLKDCKDRKTLTLVRLMSKFKTVMVACGDSFTVALVKQRETMDNLHLAFEQEKKIRKTPEEMEEEIKAILKRKTREEVEEEEEKALEKLRKSPPKRIAKLPLIHIKAYRRGPRRQHAESELKPRNKRLESVCEFFGRKLSNPYQLPKVQERAKSPIIFRKSLIKYYIQKSFEEGKTLSLRKKLEPSNKLFTSPSLCDEDSFSTLSKDQKVEALKTVIEGSSFINSPVMKGNKSALGTYCYDTIEKPKRNNSLYLSPVKQPLALKRLKELGIDDSKSLLQKKKARAYIYRHLKGRKVPLFL